MPALDIENQRFDFGDGWTFAFKYDDTDFYRDEAEPFQGTIDGTPHSTKAVDAVALHAGAGLLLLEAKDFRGSRVANKNRLRGEVAFEAAVKVRDTVAALLGASREPVTEFPSAEVAVALSQGKEVKVVLWLEDDTFRQNDPRTKQHLSALTSVLKQKLSWLNVSCFVLSKTVRNRINGLSVSDLPGAGQVNT